MQNEYEIKKRCEIGKEFIIVGWLQTTETSPQESRERSIMYTNRGQQGFMTPDYICKVDLDGNVLQANKDSDLLLVKCTYVYKETGRKIGSTCASAVYNICNRWYSSGSQSCRKRLCFPDVFRSQNTVHAVEIPDAVSEHLTSFDAVLLENHGALTYSDSLLNAYLNRRVLRSSVGRQCRSADHGLIKTGWLYEIRRQMGQAENILKTCVQMQSRKPSCHSCRWRCGAAKTAETPDARIW